MKELVYDIPTRTAYDMEGPTYAKYESGELNIPVGILRTLRPIIRAAMMISLNKRTI